MNSGPLAGILGFEMRPLVSADYANDTRSAIVEHCGDAPVSVEKFQTAVLDFQYGTYDLLLPEHEELYVFTRTLDDERLLVVLNFSAGEGGLELPGISLKNAELLIGNYPGGEPMLLRAWEARVYRLKS